MERVAITNRWQSYKWQVECNGVVSIGEIYTHTRAPCMQYIPIEV